MPKKKKKEKEFKSFEEFKREYLPDSEDKDDELFEDPEKFGIILAQRAIAELKHLISK